MLLPDNYYHIYNHANGFENLFRCDENYRFFLSKMVEHLTPVMDVYAYCLMPNHFHFLVKTKDEKTLLQLPQMNKHLDKPIKFQLDQLPFILSKVLSNLFSSYTQSFNKLYKRRGSLFVKKFKKVRITNEVQFKNVVKYIHCNPVHHGFVTDIENWPWSSYQTIISNKKTNLQRDSLITRFGEIRNFVAFHQQKSHVNFEINIEEGLFRR